MRWSRPQRDPIDALFTDTALDEDLGELAAIVHDLRSAYLPDHELRRSAELAGLTGTSLTDNGDLLVTAASNADGSALQTAGLPPLRERLDRKRAKMITAIASFVGTLTGKVAIGATVAAASVGGLHATEVIDVPLLPDAGRPAAVEVEPDAPDGDGETTVTDQTEAVPEEGGLDEVAEATDEPSREAGVDGDSVAEDARDGGVVGGDVARTAREGTPAEDRVPDDGSTDPTDGGRDTPGPAEPPAEPGPSAAAPPAGDTSAPTGARAPVEVPVPPTGRP
jgi:hypothetical protein